MRLVSVNVGRPQNTELGGHTFRTAIAKQTVRTTNSSAGAALPPAMFGENLIDRPTLEWLLAHPIGVRARDDFAHRLARLG